MKYFKIMPKITWLIIIITMIVTSFSLTASANHYNYNDFNKMSEYGKYIRNYLTVCYDKNSNPMCNQEASQAIQHNLEMLLFVNVYGSFDLSISDKNGYDLPNTNIESKKENDGLASFKYTFFSDITKIFPEFADFSKTRHFDSKEGARANLNKILRTINEENGIKKAAELIIKSCSSNDATDRSLCNEIINYKDPNYKGIFSDQALNSIFLQQMYFNSIDNINRINKIPNLKTPVDKPIFNEPTTSEQQHINNITQHVNINQIELDPLKPEETVGQVPNYLVPGGLGWLMDILTEVATRMADGLYDGLQEHFLAIKPVIFSNSDLKKVWSSIKDFVNLCFVIIFVIMIISQISGMGISNYGLKKILPKFITAVILVNISFYFTQMIIDISNISGKAIYDILSGNDSLTTGFVKQYTIKQSSASTLSDILNLILLIFTSLLVWISTLINILLLNVRDAIVILIVAASPIGLISSILPNTERISKLWWKTLINVIIIFPIIGGMVGGGKMIHAVLISTSQNNFNMFILAKLALFGSMLMIPFTVARLLKNIQGLSKTPILGGMVNNLASSDPASFAMQAKNRFDNTRVGQYRLEKIKQKTLQKRAAQTGAFGAKSALEAQKQINKQIQQNSEFYNQADASILIDTLYNRESRSYRVNNPRVSSNVKFNFANNIGMPSGVKNTALTLALSYAKDNQNHGQTDILQVLKAQAAAKNAGASQIELKDNLDQIISNLTDNKDFRSIGILRANLEYNNGTYGEFDEILIREADQNDAITNDDVNTSQTVNDTDQLNQTSHPQIQINKDQTDQNVSDNENSQAIKNRKQDTQRLKNLIRKHTKQALMAQDILSRDNLMKQINHRTIERGSIANQVFIEELRDNRNFRNGILSHYNVLSTESQNILGGDRKLLGEADVLDRELRQKRKNINFMGNNQPDVFDGIRNDYKNGVITNPDVIRQKYSEIHLLSGTEIDPDIIAKYSIDEILNNDYETLVINQKRSTFVEQVLQNNGLNRFKTP